MKSRILYDVELLNDVAQDIIKNLGITWPVEIIWRNKFGAMHKVKRGKNFIGGYAQDYKTHAKVTIYAGNKNFAEIIQMLAHELRHVYQFENGTFYTLAKQVATAKGVQYNEYPEEVDANQYRDGLVITESETNLDVRFSNDGNDTGIRRIRKFQIKY